MMVVAWPQPTRMPVETSLAAVFTTLASITLTFWSFAPLVQPKRPTPTRALLEPLVLLDTLRPLMT